MEEFAGYGFNKSHSAAYALLAYHTAYLKTHYPVEFMAALLTSETSKPENVVKYISECKELEIPVEPPDVRYSDANFTPNGKAIRFGLAAIKNVGHNAIDSIISARDALKADGRSFSNFWDFCERIDLRLMNKRVLESLIKAGALDAFGRRAQLMMATDKAMERAQKSQRDAAAGQSGLFGMFDESVANTTPDNDLPKAADWDEHQRLQAEKEVLGFFVSGHPLEKYADKLKNLTVLTTQQALETKPEPVTYRRGQEPQNEVQVAGVITGLRVAKSRKGDLYAQAAIEDTIGKLDIIAFPEAYKKLAEKLKMDVPVLIRGQLRGEDDTAPKLAISGITALEDVKIKLPNALRITVGMQHPDDSLLEKLSELLRATPGPGKVMLMLEEPGDYIVQMEPKDLSIAADRALIEKIEALAGRGAVTIIE
jgi:DNA polymerase-3 subunit alpha